MQVSRRSFLGGMGFAVAAPMILPSGVWAADPAGGRILNLAFIGMGIQARGLLGNFLYQNVHIVAICDVDKTRREDGVRRVDEFYKAHADKGKPGNCKAVADFREIIANKSIDAVVVATPDHWHAYISIAAMAAGKDVYCEKPLTYTIDEAKAVMAAAKKYGSILQTGAMQRSMTEFRTAAELARNGAIGKVTFVDCNFGGPSRPHFPPAKLENPPEGLDWDLWCGGAPLVEWEKGYAPVGVHNYFPFGWRNDDLFGSGYCGDWGAHHLDAAQWGLGMDASGPVKIIASKEPKSADPKFGFRRQTGMQMVFANGVILQHNPFSLWGTVFYGTEGVIAVNRGRFAMWQGKAVAPDAQVRATVQTGTFDGATKISFFTKKEDGGSLDGAVAKASKAFLKDAKIRLYKTKGGHTADFVACALSRKPACSNEIVGGRAAILCHLCNQSYIHDAGCDWDPVANLPAGNTADASWLVRKGGYRRGFDVKS